MRQYNKRSIGNINHSPAALFSALVGVSGSWSEVLNDLERIKDFLLKKPRALSKEPIGMSLFLILRTILLQTLRNIQHFMRIKLKSGDTFIIMITVIKQNRSNL